MTTVRSAYTPLLVLFYTKKFKKVRIKYSNSYFYTLITPLYFFTNRREKFIRTI